MNAFSKTAMLVSLNVRSYGAKKEDKKISADVAKQHNTTTDAGKYSKALVPKETLDPISKACGAMRQFHYENTLPWLDEGIRILPSANYETYKAKMGALQDDYDTAVRVFVGNWQQIIADAKVRLNGMFNSSDYPVDIRARFGCALRFMPIPDAGDFRVDISDLERDTLRDQIQDTLNQAQDAAIKDLWERVAETVKHMAERLTAYKQVMDGNKLKTEGAFRDSLVDNLRDLCDLIPRLNFAGDQALEKIRADIAAQLTTHSAQELRDNHMTRQAVAAEAERIAASISEFMV